MVRLAPDGTLLELTPQAAVLLADLHDPILYGIGQDVQRASAKWGACSNVFPRWRSLLPGTEPRLLAHGTLLRDSRRKVEAVVVLMPAPPSPRQSRSYEAEPSGLPPDLHQGLRACGLTAREAEIARFIGSGFTSPRIAVQLEITVHTVRRHTEAIFRKLGCGARSDVARLVGELNGATTNAWW